MTVEQPMMCILQKSSLGFPIMFTFLEPLPAPAEKRRNKSLEFTAVWERSKSLLLTLNIYLNDT